MRSRTTDHTTDDRDRTDELRDAIDRTGYYPEVVRDGVASAVAGEQVVSFFVHHEPTFDREEVRQRLREAPSNDSLYQVVVDVQNGA